MGPGCAADAGAADAGAACGNGVVEPALGETCDDGNRVRGDGCDEACHEETLYPGVVQVDRGQLVVRGTPLFVIGAAWLPQGVTDGDALAAGFNVLVGSGPGGVRVVPLEQSGVALPGFVSQHQEEGNLLAWLGPDEACWNGMSADTVRAEYADPLAASDPYGRPFLLNHAPRGSAAEPASFSLLQPYLSLTRVAAMDIYPIPTGNGHSNLPDHPGLDAVGAYTQILVDQVAQSGVDQAVIMVLLGAGLGHIPNEAWNNLEAWQTDEALLASGVRFVQAGDFDGDGVDELLVGSEGPGGAGTGQLVLYDFEEDTWGGRLQTRSLPADLSLAGHLLAAAGDFDGDGADDLMILVDQATDKQDFWVVPGGTPGAGGVVGLGAPTLALRAVEPDVVLQVVDHGLAADFDGDGCDDLLLSYDYPGPDHQSWLLAASACTGFAQGFPSPAAPWYDATTAELDLAQVDHAVAADMDGDNLADLLISYRAPGGGQELLRLQSTGSGLAPPEVVMQDTAAGLDLTLAPFLFAGDVEGDGAPEVVVAYSEPSGARTLRVGGLGAGAPYDAAGLVDWMRKDAATLDLDALVGAAAGDLDGDGLTDVVLVAPDPAGPGSRLQVAFSTSTDFGARDPLGKELWFMALDAVAHGASGVIYWGQSFVDASHVAWTRLVEVAGRLSALEAVLEQAPLDQGAQGTFAWRWFAGPQSSARLVVCHEAAAPGAVLPAIALPAGVTASAVDRWDGTGFAPYPDGVVGVALGDPSPFGPYEARVYAVR